VGALLLGEVKREVPLSGGASSYLHRGRLKLPMLSWPHGPFGPDTKPMIHYAPDHRAAASRESARTTATSTVVYRKLLLAGGFRIGDDDSINVVKRDGEERALCINVSADGVADAHLSNPFYIVCFPVARIHRERGEGDGLKQRGQIFFHCSSALFARGGIADGRSAGIHIVFFIAFLDICVRRDCSRICSFGKILLVIRNRLLFLQRFHVIRSYLLTPADA
jgi:hypothetical protein